MNVNNDVCNYRDFEKTKSWTHALQNIHLTVYPAHVNIKAKQASELVKFRQSCVKTWCVWREYSRFEDLRYNYPLYNCLVIVILYTKGCCLHHVVNSGTLNKANNEVFKLNRNINLFLFYLQFMSSYYKLFKR